MACAAIYWGENPGKFYDVFIAHGAVVDVSNLIGVDIATERRRIELFDLIPVDEQQNEAVSEVPAKHRLEQAPAN